MYSTYYKINKKPFELSADPSFLWMSEKYKEGLAVLRYGLQDNKGFILLTGDVGIGKTTLVNAFINSMDSNVVFANITNPGLNRTEFYNLLGATFNFGGKFSEKDDFLIAFQAFLKNCYLDGKQVLLIIDEAQRLSRDLLEEMRLLSNIELPSDKRLNIFLVGQDELNKTLDSHEYRALRQRMTLLYHLEPLSKSETGEYIQHRLHVAGAEKKIFTKKAVREIYAFSGGYPRIINIICNHAMLTGYVKQKKAIHTPVIVECAKELRLKKKSISETPRVVHIGRAIRQAAADKFKKARSFQPYLPYAVTAVFIFLLISFLYFPLKAGDSYTDIMSYWMNQVPGSGNAESAQIPATYSIYKVIDEDAGTPGGLVSGEEVITEGRLEDNETNGLENKNIEVPSVLQSDSPSVEQPSGLASQHNTIPDSEKRYSLAFEFDSNDLAPEGYERLMKTAAVMNENPEITLTISGHTDNSGEEAYNIMLSQYRADIAKKFLVSEGIASERITLIGKGSEEPIADNNSFEGRRMNRRVEVALSFQ